MGTRLAERSTLRVQLAEATGGRVYDGLALGRKRWSERTGDNDV